MHYLRYQRRFLLLATHGFHPFYDDEAQSIRDARRIPIKFEGYSISVAKGGFLQKASEAVVALRDTKWRVRVQIERELYRGLKAYFEDIASAGRPANWRAELADLPFEPYAPVRQQLLNLVRYINQRRKAANLEPLGFSVLAVSAANCAAVRNPGNVAGHRQKDRQGSRENRFLCGGIDGWGAAATLDIHMYMSRDPSCRLACSGTLPPVSRGRVP